MFCVSGNRDRLNATKVDAAGEEAEKNSGAGVVLVVKARTNKELLTATGQLQHSATVMRPGKMFLRRLI